MKRCRENEKGIMYYGVDGLAMSKKHVNFTLSRISNLQSLYVRACPLKVTGR